MAGLAWLLLMAVCGWTAGRVIGGKGLGVVTDILLGITGALTVRFFLDALRVTVHTDILLLSALGAAALPGFIRFLIRRHDGQSTARPSPTARLTKMSVTGPPVSGSGSNDTSAAA